MSFFKRLFCCHAFEFERNLREPEIFHSGGYQSQWKCIFCGVVKFRRELH